MKWSQVAVLVLCLCAIGRLAGAADIAQYDHALTLVQQSLQTEEDNDDTDQPASSLDSWQLAKRVLTPIAEVQTPDGVNHTVDSREIVHAIAVASRLKDSTARARAFRALRRQLAGLRADLETPAPQAGQTPQPDPVLVLRSVLNGPAFQSLPPPPPSWGERAWDWIGKQLAKLHLRPAPMPAMDISPRFVQVLIVILVAVVVAVLVAIIVPLITNRTVRARENTSSEEEELIESRDSDRLLVLAEQKASAGDFRHAFRLVYLATLIALDSAGILRFDRSKTNWEYLRALQSAQRSDILDKMRPLTRTFDRVWYGFAPVGSTEYARALAEHRALVELSRSAVIGATAPVLQKTS